MNVALRKPTSLDEFLAWEREQAARYEFDGLRPVAINGGTLVHSEIATNLVEYLRGQLRGTRCRAVRGDVKIEVIGRVRYPDVAVTCSPVENDADVLPNPVVVFEVISKTSAVTDRIEKNEEYRQTPSIQHYVMLEQARPAATVFSRIGGDWIGRVVTAEGQVSLPEIGVTLPLRAAYVGIEFPLPGA